VTPEAYLERVRALLVVLRERTARAEQLRRLPDETFADFQEAGLFRALQPKRYGGYELDPATFYEAVMEVGAVCGSSAWILGVIGVHNWHLAILPPQAQEDVWGEDSSVQLSTSLAPTGTVGGSMAGFVSAGGGRSLVAAISASGLSSAGSCRRSSRGNHRTRACF
jgi:3-hydroxy-9,10-secoandrosta-1,3,5(10)-triene-9,17-dione monooxygenase